MLLAVDAAERGTEGGEAIVGEIGSAGHGLGPAGGGTDERRFAGEGDHGRRVGRRSVVAGLAVERSFGSLAVMVAGGHAPVGLGGELVWSFWRHGGGAIDGRHGIGGGAEGAVARWIGWRLFDIDGELVGADPATEDARHGASLCLGAVCDRGTAEMPSRGRQRAGIRADVRSRKRWWQRRRAVET